MTSGIQWCLSRKGFAPLSFQLTIWFPVPRDCLGWFWIFSGHFQASIDILIFRTLTSIPYLQFWNLHSSKSLNFLKFATKTLGGKTYVRLCVVIYIPLPCVEKNTFCCRNIKVFAYRVLPYTSRWQHLHHRSFLKLTIKYWILKSMWPQGFWIRD